jgi:transcriptional regulator of acetoin/glycerol metabolism
MDHSWPGNVRELRNAIEHALVTASGSVIMRSDLPVDIRGGACSSSSLTPEQYAERERVLAALTEAQGHRTRAAALLGTSRVTLWKKMRLFGLEDRNGDGHFGAGDVKRTD